MDERSLLPDTVEFSFLEALEDGQYNADLEMQLGQAVAQGESPALIRIWRSAHQPGIAVSRKDVAGPGGQSAAQTLRDRGLAVIVRQTGGTAVPQGDGVLHLSFILPRQQAAATTDAYYRLLCAPLVRWLEENGISATTGELPGSYCDGSYNVLANGRKLVGTAQAWRGGLAGVSSRHPGFVLAHACIMIDLNLMTALSWINEFYALAGQDYRVNPDTSVTLRDVLPDRDWRLDAAENAKIAAMELADVIRRLYHL
ncbi:lipoate--protein ligase family protein [Alicyclobacillus herbarius]|uniref:lipoate--protein ligase family protein n=1 Tax=Alicyclobacillus herbarius TaxID=122960 RepID=UPI002353D664|nr:ligase [Alicyclobacillus herbarius]